MRNSRSKGTGTHGWLKALIFFVVYITLMSVGGLIYGVPLPKGSPGVSFDTLLAITSLLSVLAAFAFRKWIDKRTIISMGFHRQGMLSDSLGGLLSAMFLICAGAFTLYLLKSINWISVEMNPTIIPAFAVLGLVAVAEETVFRGYILRNMMKSFHRRLSLLTTSLLFTLVHLMNPGVPVLGVLNIFLGGWVLGLLFLRTRNLWAPIFFHFAWNFFQGPVLGFEVSGVTFDPIFTPTLSGNMLLTGGDFGFEGSVICTGFLLIMIGFLSWRRRKRRRKIIVTQY